MGPHLEVVVSGLGDPSLAAHPPWNPLARLILSFLIVVKYTRHKILLL